MPFKRRTYVKKRIYKRRRKSMRRFRRRRGQQYDGSYKVKLQYNLPLENHVTWSNDPATGAKVEVSWGLPDAQTSVYQASLGSCPEWANFNTRWYNYRVNGVKMEYKPSNWQASTASGKRIVKQLWVASYPDFIGPTGTAASPPVGEFPIFSNFMQYPDYKQLDGSKPYSKYVNVRKFQKNSSGISKYVELTDRFSTGATVFILNTANFDAQDDMGFIAVTYYVEFQRQAIAAP